MQKEILSFLKGVEEPVTTREIMEYLSGRGYNPNEEELVRVIKDMPKGMVKEEYKATVIDPSPSVVYKAGPDA
jgi:repressor of nif and glnA expression